MAELNDPPPNVIDGGSYDDDADMVVLDGARTAIRERAARDAADVGERH